MFLRARRHLSIHMNVNLKTQAIKCLKTSDKVGTSDIINIIETIMDCYVGPSCMSNEEKFLVAELQSFVTSLKNDV